jgi:Mrr N-terminal domain
MAPTIRVDDEVWTWLKSHARPLEDTPNSVLRRLAGLESGPEGMHTGRTNRTLRGRRVLVDHTPQAAFREPILRLLHHHGGSLERTRALAALEQALAHQLTEADRSDIDSGTIRWQKNAEWQIYAMRQAGLLEPVERSGNGMWTLTARGMDMAAKLATD